MVRQLTPLPGGGCAEHTWVQQLSRTQRAVLETAARSGGFTHIPAGAAEPKTLVSLARRGITTYGDCRKLTARGISLLLWLRGPAGAKWVREWTEEQL
jgi:hypothetical protein